MNAATNFLLLIFAISSVFKSSLAFTAPVIHKVTWNKQEISRCTLAQSSPDNWGMEDDPRMEAMRKMLEGSWNGQEMGKIPSSPEKAAEAAAESVALAMGKSHNVLMIDLRLPSYDITEGPRLYDKKAVYDFCTTLTTELQEKKLITKSLILVRNEDERRETERISQISAKAKALNDSDDGNMDDLEFSPDVTDFRKKLMNSWDSPVDLDDISRSDQSTTKSLKNPIKPTSSHRLWSMVGDGNINPGSDMFERVIAAVDTHARLDVSEQEDALIIISPYDTVDVIAVRRILARYGQTRTIIIVNSRMETLPIEMDNAILVYGIMPLVARSTSNNAEARNDEAGLRVVVMKRFPREFNMYIDVNGDGFVKVNEKVTNRLSVDSKEFPSSQWIVKNVQAHVEGLSQ